ncbi:MAG: class I SAM-dependent methyltransferase, partial [Holophagales bacterium]|nr:class I SAM-dependent methyltransferase [Holophagales bacterium]
DADYARRYRQLYERHWWWRARERFVEDLLEDLAPTRGFGPILDVGCGDGLFLPRLERFGEPEGLEPDDSLVSPETRATGRIHVRPFDAGFRPGRRYGLILMLDVLEHVDDDRAALRHLRSLLEPGARAVLTVPAFRALWTRHDELNHHRTRYTRSRLGRSLESAGLEIERLRYFFHWLAPVKLAVRAREALFPGPGVPASVPPEPLNSVLYASSRLEQRTWGRLPWPVGSSILALCRRPSGSETAP